MPEQEDGGHRPTVTVIGQEGDEVQVPITPEERCEKLLQEGLKALYGNPPPDPSKYDLVFGGKVVSPLTQTLREAGIQAGATVSILPQTISRGSGRD